MIKDMELDLGHLTKDERDIILQVLDRDAQLREREKKRIGLLNKQLIDIRIENLSSTDMPSIEFCSLCRHKFTKSKGVACFACHQILCQKCRHKTRSSNWICTICRKQRDLEAKMGRWFYSCNEAERNDNVSDIVRITIVSQKPSPVGVVSPTKTPGDPSGRSSNQVSHQELTVVDSSSVCGDDASTSFPMDDDKLLLGRLLQRSSKNGSESSTVVEVQVRESSPDQLEKFDDEQSMVKELLRLASTDATPTSPADSPEMSQTKTFKELDSSDDSAGEVDSPCLSSRSGSVFRKSESIQSSIESMSQESAFFVPMDGAMPDTALSSSTTTTKTVATGTKVNEIVDGRVWRSNSFVNRLNGDSSSCCDSSLVPDEEVNGGISTTNGNIGSDTRDDDREVSSSSDQYMNRTGADISSKSTSLTMSVENEIIEEDVKPFTDDESETVGEMFSVTHNRRIGRSNPNLSSFLRRAGSTESITSTYSNAGEGNYGKIEVSGEIQLGLNFDEETNILEVNIVRCKDVAPVDKKRNRSDPYVKVYLLPDRTKNGKRKTRTKKHTLSPIFNEILKYKISKEELKTRTLCAMVWNSDRFGRNDFLGEIKLPLVRDCLLDDSTPIWYQLQDRSSDLPNSWATNNGELSLGLKFVGGDQVFGKKHDGSYKGELHVMIREARNLTAIRANGYSHPFCKGYLLPDKSHKGKRKTPVIKRNCNPRWNCLLVFEDVSLEELWQRSLELTIWDYDRLTSNDFLGGVRLNLGAGTSCAKPVSWMDARDDEISTWLKMLEKANCWVEGILPLRLHMNEQK